MRVHIKNWILIAFLAAPGLLPANAQQMQPWANREASQVQQGMNNGVFTPGQAAQLDGQINQIQQQAQTDRAANGGQLTPQESQQLHQEAYGVRQNMQASAMQNGYTPPANGGTYGYGHHHHRYNPNGAPPAYNQGSNVPPPSPWYQTPAYNNGQQPVPYQNYNNGWQQNYNNGQQPQPPYQYPNQQQQQGSGVTSLLRNLFH